MKTLRSILVFLCGLMIMGGCLLFYISGLTQHLFSSQVSSVLIESIDLETPIHKALTGILGNNIASMQIEAQILQQTDSIKKTLINNKDFTAFVDKYSLEVLNSLANENQPIPDIDGDIQAIITKHEAEIQENLGDVLSESDKHKLIEAVKKNLKLSPVYENIVGYAKDRLTDEQLNVIKFIDTFTKPFTKTLSIVMVIAASIIIILLKLSPYKWLFPVGFAISVTGILLLGTGYLVPHIIPSAYSMTLNFVNEECLRMLDYAYAYLAVGVSILIIYGGCRVFLATKE